MLWLHVLTLQLQAAPGPALYLILLRMLHLVKSTDTALRACRNCRVKQIQGMHIYHMHSANGHRTNDGEPQKTHVHFNFLNIDKNEIANRTTTIKTRNTTIEGRENVDDARSNPKGANTLI